MADHFDAPPDLAATHPMPSPVAAGPTPRWEGSGSVLGGRYTLLECVGRGGMGAVWSARQTAPVKRVVAVKLLGGRSDTRNVLARFEAERQALAVMDHPNVAKILDGGVTDFGAPYFVMEYVKGVPITEFCDRRQLTTAQRLELFVPVCEAIHHAHQKGIIHRDVKPSNVLVALEADRAVPKVIDFGVAKATGPALTDLTLNTGAGVVVGTPQYMSPEQASFTGLDIDTRSDVYSLGVLLYELLTGGPPFAQRDDSREGLFEILRLIREEDPTRPSGKLGASEELPLLGERRGTDPAKLAGLLRSELDWVVMKALEKDRARRYDSAAAFAADVRRYLAGEAVLAHPPSLRYRLGKSLRRNRVAAAVAAAFVLTHVAGLTATTAGLIRADAARAAEAEQRVAADAGRVRAEAAEALAEDRREDAVAAQKRTMTALRAATGEDVERLLGARAELGPHERAYLQAIVQRWQGFARSGGDTPEARAVAAEGAIHVATLRGKLGEQVEAVAGLREAVAIYEGLARDFPEAQEYRRELAVAHTLLGNLLRARGQADQAAAEHRRAVEVLGRLAADAPAVPEYRRFLAACQSNLGVALGQSGQAAESEAQFRRALAVLGDLVRESPTRQNREAVAADRTRLGGALQARGQVAEAAACYRLAIEDQVKLAAEFPDVRKYRGELSASRDRLGHLLQAQGDTPAAEEQFRLAVETQAKLTADYPSVPKYRVSLGRCCSSLGNLLRDAAKWPEALTYHDRAVAALTVAAAAQSGDVITLGLLRDAHLGRAATLTGAGRPADAAKDRARAAELAPPAGRPTPKPELAPPPRAAQ